MAGKYLKNSKDQTKPNSFKINTVIAVGFFQQGDGDDNTGLCPKKPINAQ